jgi:phosphoglycerate dehydrogenase-like enzyme
MAELNLLVVEDPAAPYLHRLENRSAETMVVATADLSLLHQAAPKADVIFVGMSRAHLLRPIFPEAARARWIHSFSAGVEKIVFPQLLASDVTLTNARGVFKRPLAEFVIASVLFFAKDLRRLVRSQEAGVWEQFDMEEVHGKVMGIVGYGETGKACAERARAFGLKVFGLRRRPELSEDDPLLERVFAADLLREMLPLCDYIVLAAPSTRDTRGLIGEAEIACMKPEAVVMNVGRGSLIDERALIPALEHKRIRGAALDVFETEPLPPGHPFYRLKNVLLSPHCADHTPDWLDLAMECFMRNLERFQKGEALENIVDKTAGY